MLFQKKENKYMFRIIKNRVPKKEFSLIFFINFTLLMWAFCLEKVHGFNIVQVAQIFRHGHRYSVYNFFNRKANFNLKLLKLNPGS